MKHSCLIRGRTLALVIAALFFTGQGALEILAQVTVPDGFVAEVFAVNLGGIEDFGFDEDGVLWVGSGFPGTVVRIEFEETTPLPIDGSGLLPAIVGLDAVFGVAFDAAGNLFLPEFCSGDVTRINAALLSGPFPIDAGLIQPLTVGLGCPDGAAFAPFGSPFGTNLFVGDVDLRGVVEIDPGSGAVVSFTDFGDGIEEVVYSNDGQRMYAFGASILVMEVGSPPEILASGFVFLDALAQGPGNEFGVSLYVGDLFGRTLFRVDSDTGIVETFADLGPNFAGFEDIIFDDLGRMYILGFGLGGQIVRISGDACADDDGDGQVTICHIPPGNSDNAHTITVSIDALPTHLTHGDMCGPCGGDGELPARNAAIVIHVELGQCFLLDGIGNLVGGEGIVVITNNLHGDIIVKCGVQGVENPVGQAVHWNYANTGFQCVVDLGDGLQTSTNWHETVSAGGIAMVTCRIP